MRILLTNDDSLRSPLLEFIVKFLHGAGHQLTIVVPRYEQSWKGKAMTRFQPLHLGHFSVAGLEGYTLDGTPADCINAGIYCVAKEKPDLIVSGINAGLNTGVSFIFSSGTVGACLEANIAGIPGVALSQAFDTATRNRYLLDYTLEEATLRRLETQTANTLQFVFSGIEKLLKADSSALTYNVNLPWEQTSPGIKLAPLAHLYYGRCFTRDGDRLVHGSAALMPRQEQLDDVTLVGQGAATLSVLDLHSFGRQIGEQQRGLIEGCFANQ